MLKNGLRNCSRFRKDVRLKPSVWKKLKQRVRLKRPSVRQKKKQNV